MHGVQDARRALVFTLNAPYHINTYRYKAYHSSDIPMQNSRAVSLILHIVILVLI
jgi:hypothetical protein